MPTCMCFCDTGLNTGRALVVGTSVEGSSGKVRLIRVDGRGQGKLELLAQYTSDAGGFNAVTCVKDLIVAAERSVLRVFSGALSPDSLSPGDDFVSGHTHHTPDVVRGNVRSLPLLSSYVMFTYVTCLTANGSSVIVCDEIQSVGVLKVSRAAGSTRIVNIEFQARDPHTLSIVAACPYSSASTQIHSLRSDTHTDKGTGVHTDTPELASHNGSTQHVATHSTPGLAAPQAPAAAAHENPNKATRNASTSRSVTAYQQPARSAMDNIVFASDEDRNLWVLKYFETQKMHTVGCFRFRSQINSLRQCQLSNRKAPSQGQSTRRLDSTFKLGDAAIQWSTREGSFGYLIPIHSEETYKILKTIERSVADCVLGAGHLNLTKARTCFTDYCEVLYFYACVGLGVHTFVCHVGLFTWDCLSAHRYTPCRLRPTESSMEVSFLSF